MGTPGLPDREPARRVHLPRWLCAALFTLVVTVIYPFLVIVLPWAISSLTPRYGWGENGPATWNRLGLVPIAAGIAGLVWVFTVMFAQLPKFPNGIDLEADERPWSATAKLLLTHGPFAFSRNPMFFSGLTVWFGWAVFYGNALLLILAIALSALTNYVIVPKEERALEARFGEVYRDYRRHVRRWIGWSRRR